MSEPCHYSGPLQTFIERSSDPNARRLEYLRWLVQRPRDDDDVTPTHAMDGRAPVPIRSKAETYRPDAA